MTALEDDDARDEKRGVETDAVDAETLLEYLEQHGGATIDGLATTVGVTTDTIRDLILTLKTRDQVRVHPRQNDVLVESLPSVDGRVRPDGGFLALFGRAGSEADRQLEMTERQVFNLLSNERRRMVLRLLSGTYDADEPQYLETREVAEALANAETTDTSTGDIHRVYVSLTQVHLPLMDSLGVIEHYDRVEKVCATTDAVIAADLLGDIAEVAADPSQTAPADTPPEDNGCES